MEINCSYGENSYKGAVFVKKQRIRFAPGGKAQKNPACRIFLQAGQTLTVILSLGKIHGSKSPGSGIPRNRKKTVGTVRSGSGQYPGEVHPQGSQPVPLLFSYDIKMVQIYERC